MVYSFRDPRGRERYHGNQLEVTVQHHGCLWNADLRITNYMYNAKVTRMTVAVHALPDNPVVVTL